MGLGVRKCAGSLSLLLYEGLLVNVVLGSKTSFEPRREQCVHIHIEIKQTTGRRNYSSFHFNPSEADDEDDLMFGLPARWTNTDHSLTGCTSLTKVHV